jgi:hypothetical protein
VFLGFLDDPRTVNDLKAAKWTEKYFELVRPSVVPTSVVPVPGDVVVATAKINLRSGVIENTGGRGWINKPAVGLALPKEKYVVSATAEPVPGFWWAQVQFTR